MRPWTSATRHLARFSSPRSPASQAPSLIHCRRLATGGAGHHGAAKVSFWQDPMHPSKWKEEHFVIVSLAGWGLLIYGGYKMFSGDSKKNQQGVGDKPQ